jgi:uncharacterized protein YjbJ (UPF0337 family)
VSGADKAKNKRQELGGMAKEAVGKFTGDKSTEAEGKRGQVKANLKDAGEKLKEASVRRLRRRTGKSPSPWQHSRPPRGNRCASDLPEHLPR